MDYFPTPRRGAKTKCNPSENQCFPQLKHDNAAAVVTAQSIKIGSFSVNSLELALSHYAAARRASETNCGGDVDEMAANEPLVRSCGVRWLMWTKLCLRGNEFVDTLHSSTCLLKKPPFSPRYSLEIEPPTYRRRTTKQQSAHCTLQSADGAHTVTF